jgi:hypothetical protein
MNTINEQINALINNRFLRANAAETLAIDTAHECYVALIEAGADRELLDRRLASAVAATNQAPSGLTADAGVRLLKAQSLGQIEALARECASTGLLAEYAGKDPKARAVLQAARTGAGQIYWGIERIRRFALEDYFLRGGAGDTTPLTAMSSFLQGLMSEPYAGTTDGGDAVFDTLPDLEEFLYVFLPTLRLCKPLIYAPADFGASQPLWGRLYDRNGDLVMINSLEDAEAFFRRA